VFVNAGGSSSLDMLTFIYGSDARTYSEVALSSLFMLMVVDEMPRPVLSVFMPVDDISRGYPSSTLGMTVKEITKKVETLMVFIINSKGQRICVKYRMCCLGIGDIGPGEDSFYIMNIMNK